MEEMKNTLTLTYSQAWSIASSIAVGVFVLSMIYASFENVRSIQQSDVQMFEDFKKILEGDLINEKQHQDFLYKETNRRLDTKTLRLEETDKDFEIRIKKLESK